MIIRANQLRKGDVFIKQNAYYRVLMFENGITYATNNTSTGRRNGTWPCVIGSASLERIELISRIIIRKRIKKPAGAIRLQMAEFATT